MGSDKPIFTFYYPTKGPVAWESPPTRGGKEFPREGHGCLMLVDNLPFVGIIHEEQLLRIFDGKVMGEKSDLLRWMKIPVPLT